MTRALCFLLASTVTAAAHDTATGWSYDAVCCSNTDCAVIPYSAVEIRADGVRVTLRPGDHPMVTREHTFTRAFKDLRQSRDDEWHACVREDVNGASLVVYCVYQPPMGM